MDIEIKNAQGAIDNCNSIMAYRKALSDKIASLQSLVQKLESNWQSGGADKETYLAELNKQINNYTILETTIGRFANTVTTYAQNIQQTSKKTVDVVIGGNFDNSNVSTGYGRASYAVNDKNGKTLNTNVVNENSTINGFAYVNEKGRVEQTANADGMSLNEFMEANNYSIEDIAIDVAKNGESQAWISASDLFN